MSVIQLLKQELKIINKTDYSDQELKEIVEFCNPDMVNGITVNVHYGNGSGFSYNDSRKIDVTVPKPNTQSYPFLRHPEKVYRKTPWKYYELDGQEYAYHEQIRYRYTLRPPIVLLSRTEFLIDTMAHELRHQWQRRRPLKSQWTYGNRGKKTHTSEERDACAFAKTKVRAWRKLHPIKDAYNLAPCLDHPMGLDSEYPYSPTHKVFTVSIWKKSPDKKSWIPVFSVHKTANDRGDIVEDEKTL